MPRRRSETDTFRLALMQLRTHLGWTQQTLGARLGVTRRTVSSWETGYWLPPHKQRLHVVLSLREVPPEYVLAIADALGVSVDPAVKPFLQPFLDALDPPEEPAAPAAPPPPRPTSAQLRDAVDLIVRDAADAMDVRANELRAVVARAVAACGELGATMDETSDAVAVRAAVKGKRES